MKQGRIPWNKGLTKETDERVRKQAKNQIGIIFSEEHKRKLSKSHKGQIAWNKGLTDIYSEETRRKMSEMAKKRTLSEETRRRISKAVSGKNHPNWGKHFSKEVREKMSKTRIERKLAAGKNNPFFGIHFSGDKNPRWKGGRRSYYAQIAHKVWEAYWKKIVPRGSVIHHIDGNITNNHITNLACMSLGKHSSLHHRMRSEARLLSS